MRGEADCQTDLRQSGWKMLEAGFVVSTTAVTR
jgi:hypothetical protein